ncbi:MAG TPA: cell envelope integrity protein CreD [Rubricoccaceae bacterium]|jgi:inner membrane protein
MESITHALAAPPADPKPSWARRSVTFKIAAIGAIILVLLVPMLMLGGLISERESLRDGARREVSAQWGQDQTLGGPVLTVPYTVTTRSGEGANATVQTETRYVHLFPDRLDVTGTMAPEVRQRGIFKVVLYNARLAVSGQFPALDAAGLGITAGALRPGEAFVQVGISDMVGLRDAVAFRWGATTREADPGIATTDVFESGVSIPVRLNSAGSPAATPFAFRLNLNGSGTLGLLPVGKQTRLSLRSPWATPRFAGAFLPERRTVGDSGFAADWRVLHLNRNFPQQFTGAFGRPTRLDAGRAATAEYTDYTAESAGMGSSTAFGVELLLPVDEYQKTSRAAKYGMLFVFLTFLTFFFVEILGDRRIHPIQYLLVGFAVTLFYLLLLAFAEYMAFDGAYGLAAVGILALVTLYARAVFAEWRLAGLVGGLLAVFYGYFYVLLQQEQYALLLGSLGLLVTLAAVMYLSRKVDWYGMSASGPAPLPAPPPVSGPPVTAPAAPEGV